MAKRKKKWKGNPKRFQWKEWRRGFGINPKTGEQFKPYLKASKDNRKGIITLKWRR